MTRRIDRSLGADEAEYDSSLIAECKRLLQLQSFTTQDEIRRQLTALGFGRISQSTISRLLLRLDVVKVPNAYGRKVYCLAVENETLQVDSTISSQIEFITHNQLFIVVRTHPGSAQLIARIIDVQPHEEILGTISGNDTVMVAPRDINHIDECEIIVKAKLGLPSD